MLNRVTGLNRVMGLGRLAGLDRVTGLDRYAVVGHPVDHSLSPTLHAAFARQTGQRMRYDLLPAPLAGFADVAAAFFAAGGSGLNVTVPFKEQAAQFVDSCDAGAHAAGAVNTIRVLGGSGAKPRTEGLNTDGVGLIADLQTNLGWALRDKHILLLGAGGAARGALVALLGQGCASVTIANRTLARARALVQDLAAATTDVQTLPAVCELADLAEPVDVVINATAASLAGKGDLVAPLVVEGARCYDMLYAAAETEFCRWAQANGALATSDGLGMLVEQAAEAFYLWRDVRPDSRAVLDQRDQLFAGL